MADLLITYEGEGINNDVPIEAPIMIFNNCAISVTKLQGGIILLNNCAIVADAIVLRPYNFNHLKNFVIPVVIATVEHANSCWPHRYSL